MGFENHISINEKEKVSQNCSKETGRDISKLFSG